MAQLGLGALLGLPGVLLARRWWCCGCCCRRSLSKRSWTAGPSAATKLISRCGVSRSNQPQRRWPGTANAQADFCLPGLSAWAPSAARSAASIICERTQNFWQAGPHSWMNRAQQPMGCSRHCRVGWLRGAIPRQNQQRTRVSAARPRLSHKIAGLRCWRCEHGCRWSNGYLVNGLTEQYAEGLEIKQRGDELMKLKRSSCIVPSSCCQQQRGSTFGSPPAGETSVIAPTAADLKSYAVEYPR